MKLSLCNEVLRDLDFAAQCAMAAKLGYDGLEVAPFTLSEAPHLLSAGQRTALRRTAKDSGIAITGLHWLLVTPQGLSLNGQDSAARAATIEMMERLVDLCADLGGSVLVHGSPTQRSIADGDDVVAGRRWAVEGWRAAARAAERAGVIYCIEPLSRAETNFINTIEEAVSVVDEVGSPALRAMIDTSAAGQAEVMSVAALIDHWLPTGKIAHIQFNDTNRRAPGQGKDDFVAILAALKRQGYQGVAAVEPFIYQPDGPTTAARAIGYLRGLMEASS